MASTSYKRRKAKAAEKKYVNMRATKERKRLERAEQSKVVGTMRTDGIFGDHLIELIDCGDEEFLWIRVDGALRRPRTCAGVGRIIKGWIWEYLTEKRRR